MGRKTTGTNKVWRETLSEVTKAHGIGVTKVSEAMGRDGTWLYKKMPKGYGEFSDIEIIALCHVIGCTKEELMALPVSPGGQKTASISPNGTNLDDVLVEMQNITAEMGMGLKALQKDRPTMTKQDELYELVRSVAKMLHNDMVNLLEAAKGAKS